MKITDTERAKIREIYTHTEDKHGYIDRMCEKYDMTRTQLMKELGTNAHELAGKAGAGPKDAPARLQRYPKETVEEAVAAVLAGERRADVAARVGCSRPALNKWIRDAKATGAVPEAGVQPSAPPTPEAAPDQQADLEQVKDYVTKDVYLPKRNVKVRPDGRIEITIQVIVEPLREDEA